MYCKYCKKNNHEIEKCPDIICKNCKNYGHPHWKCKSKNNISSNPIISNNLNNLIKKNLIEEDNNNYDINYYLQFIDKLWGDI
jgi:hypothetical protein